MIFRTLQKIRRKITGAVNSDGYYEKGNFVELPIKMSVQPVNTQEYTNYEPQGGRTMNLIKVYTNAELYPMRDGIEADVLEWHGKLWRCIRCEFWQSGVISHYKAIFREIDSYEGNSEEISARYNSGNSQFAAE